MKVTTNEKPAGFEPITLTIVIESESELKALWQRTNMDEGIAAQYGGIHVFPEPEDKLLGLWKTIDSICVKRGLK